ncbi:inositol monophosphatase family protein [Asticcacaulis endophyticus]|uniref:3'(2'),5'-bisphosphate nucleotidase CysQ n=1 Tax=Asticcacaulis endophyticus TaxID=1395890 RepID=A0A918QF29_9CAUL|nr:3'(2'),5'-bisphosphate nucleotidase CysQ [Asticcacaulis endophyticus]GGZ43698.1 3'(2'),5'-bisphosphate nucleotidase CysQ [Asticcacaulis endophyticus]
MNKATAVTADARRELEEDLALLVDKVRRVGALAQHVKAQGLIIDYKSDGSVVTNADLEVNLWLKEALMQVRPHYGWQSEESPDTDARLSKARVFVLDPIDGTMGFTKGSPYWTIALAIVENGQPVAGVVYAPDAQELYAAGLGLGATLNGAPIHATTTAALDGAHVIGDARVFGKAIWRGDWPRLLVTSRPSVAYRMVCVAAGRADFTLALTPKRDWDVAASTLIAREAGAKTSDHLGNPYHFNGKSSLKPSLVCACEPLYAEIIRRCGHLATLDHI